MGQANSIHTHHLPEIPEVIWTNVFEYLFFDELSRASRVSKLFLNELLPQVLPKMGCLYICSTAALTVQQASRFGGESGNVEEIVIDGIYRLGFHTVYGQPRREWHLCDEGVGLGIFLSCFPKLRNVYLGQGIRESKREILDRLHLEPCAEGEMDRFRLKRPIEKLKTDHLHLDRSPFKQQFYHGLANAYRKGRLSREVHILGIPPPDELVSIHILTSFPIEQIMFPNNNTIDYVPYNVGTGWWLLSFIARDHPDAKEFFQSRPDLCRKYLRDLFQVSGFCVRSGVLCFGDDFEMCHLTYLKIAVENGFCPGKVDSQLVSESLSAEDYASIGSPPHRISTDAFEFLSNGGLSVEMIDFDIAR